MRVGRLESAKVGTLILGLTFLLSNVPTFHLSQWRPEDRVVISDFSQVAAVAASPFTMFAATRRGLLVYDRTARRWQWPVTALDGYPTAPARVALADATDDAVWLGTATGWARYDARIRHWQSGPVPGGVRDLALDPRDPASGIYLLGGSGWTFLPRGALLPFGNRPLPAGAVRPLDPRAALAQAPQADALRALILTDPALRTYQFTAAARTQDQAELFFGTNGLGVVRVDGFAARWDVLSYGLPGTGAAALAPAPDGVWVGSIPRAGERAALAWVAADASTTRWVEGSGTGGLGFREARHLLARAGRLWIVTERGVARLDPATERVDLIPVDQATVLAPAPDGVWVGTQRGLVLVTDGGQVVSFGAPGDLGVLSLLAANDSVWVGSTAGLLLLAPGMNAARPPADVSAAPVLRNPIFALTRVRDTLVAATTDQLAWRDPAGTWTVLRPTADVGPITAVTPDARGVWVGGERGLAYWSIAARTFRALRVPADLPAGVRDMLVAPPYLWVATDSGVVRLRREAAIER